MSLMKCPECGHEVSDMATSCPQCGCPLNHPKSQLFADGKQAKKSATGRAAGTIAVVTLAIIALAAAALWFLFFRGGTNEDERIAYETIMRYQNDDQLDSMSIALNDYLDTYNSDAFHFSQLKELNDRYSIEHADWNATEGALSLEAVRHFLDIHPDGFYLRQANLMMDSLSYAAALEENTHEALERYVSQFPQGKFLADARKQMTELDNVELSVEEKSGIMETLRNHFDALADNDQASISATLASEINSYIGKANPELEDIYAYMQNMHSSGRELVFLVKNANITKMDVAGRSVYNVQFTLEEETYARGQHTPALDTDAGTSEEQEDEPKPTNVKHFTGTAVLNQAQRITSLVLKQ